MSRGKQTGLMIFVAVLLAGAAFFWLHGRGGRPRMGEVSADAAALPSDAPRTGDLKEPPLKDRISAPAAASPAPTPSVPVLKEGETLEFSADVAKLSNVAALRLLVRDQRDFGGKKAWHLQAFAHTQNPLRMVFALDDQFDSYSDAATLASLQYEMHLNERGQKVDSIQRMTVTGREPAPANGSAARVPAGTRDPLGMMQYLRNVEWAKNPVVHGTVYDGHKIYEVKARLTNDHTSVQVPAGSFAASKIAIQVFDNGAPMKDASFTLFLARDALRTPVLLEAVLPFATARVGLTKAR